MRMLCCPFLFPDKASSLLAGGILRSCTVELRFSILSFLKAILWILCGSFFENCLWNIFSVSRHLKLSIIMTNAITHNVMCQDCFLEWKIFSPIETTPKHRFPKRIITIWEICKQKRPIRTMSNWPKWLNMAEREGFEPSVELSPHTRLAGERLQPARPPLRDADKSAYQ